MSSWQQVLPITVAVIVLIAANILGKKYPLVASILLALPFTSLLALTALYLQTNDLVAVSKLSRSIFWMVLPTLAFFQLLPFLLEKGFSFWFSLGISSLIMFILFKGYVAALKLFDINLD